MPQERKTIKTGIFYRTVSEVRNLDEEKRTVELAFSSEAPVDRWFGQEILDHDKKSIRLGFLKSGRAPLLKDHNREAQIGVVESISVGGGVGRATVRFSDKSELARQEFGDVVDGIRSNVSVGYRVYSMVLEKQSDDGDVYRVDDWEPLEISLVSIPADQGVGVGRANGDGEKYDTTITFKERGKEMPETKTQTPAGEPAQVREPVAPTVDADAINRDATGKERSRIAGIMAIGRAHGFNKEAETAAQDGTSVDGFREFVLSKLAERKKPEPVKDPEIGMGDGDVRQYSFMKAVRAALLGPKDPQYIRDAGFELECSRTAQEVAGREARGIMVPHDVLARGFAKRTLTAGTATDGAELVADNLLAGSFVDVLRNRVICMEMGARVLDGLVGDVLIPRKTSGSAGTWVSAEHGDAGNSEAQFDQISLTPNDVAGYTDLSRRLLKQSTPSVEALIRDDLAKAIAIALDLAGLYGSGSSGQPTGIANTTGINAPTAFAAAVPTFPEVVAMESAVAADNADVGSTGYIVNANMRGSFKTTEKFSGTGLTIWEKGGTVNGYTTGVTNQVTDGDVFFGNWADLLIGLWGGLDLTADPYTLSLKGGVRLVAFQTADIAVRHPVSFAYNNDGV